VAIDTAKSLKKVPPPLQDPMVDPKTGRLTAAWANYFVRLPLTFTDASDRLDVAEDDIDATEDHVTVLNAQAATLEAQAHRPPELTYESVLWQRILGE
jgi:hypothetical protein